MTKVQKIDDIQARYRDEALALAALMSQYNPCEVIKGEDRTDFHVKMAAGDTFLRVRKDYNGYIDIARYDYPRYAKLSQRTVSDVYAKNVTNNMKVPTLKKVVDKINAITRTHDELERLQKYAIEKHRMFLCDIEALKLPVVYSYNYTINDEHKRENTDIKGGHIIKNGIQYEFELCEDGYVSQKVALHYSVSNTMQDFVLLADNKYTK